jgi:glycosyltransferase involved in cell wall biosynthesis
LTLNPLAMGDPIRVLYIHHEPDLYGSGRAMLRALGQLDRSRYMPFVVLPKNGPLVDELRKVNVPVIFHPSLTYLRRAIRKPPQLARWLAGIPKDAWGLVRLIRENRISLVHTNSSIIVASPLAAWLAGVPHIMHVREFYADFGKLWKILRFYIEHFSSAIVAVSHAVAAQFHEGRAEVIHDGYPTAAFDMAGRQPEKMRKQHELGDAFVVGCVGRIKMRRKGQDFLVAAARVLKTKGLPIKYLIVGSPHPDNLEHLDRLRDLIRANDLEKDVILAGEIADPLPAFAAMDVFVLPSCDPEPLGNVILEAMGMRKPVIATSLGGSPEMVEEGISGFLVEPNNAEQLADRIYHFHRDREAARRMGEAGRQRLETRFDLVATTGQAMDLYDRILRRPSAVKWRAEAASHPR